MIGFFTEASKGLVRKNHRGIKCMPILGGWSRVKKITDRFLRKMLRRAVVI